MKTSLRAPHSLRSGQAPGRSNLIVSIGIASLLALLAMTVVPVEAAYESRGKRDPFVPLLTEDGQRIVPPGLDEGETTDLTLVELQGVVFDPSADSYAVINGQVIRERETVGHVQILKITPTAVTIRVDGKEKQLPVPQTSEEIKSSP